jgi:hypothetical protein
MTFIRAITDVNEAITLCPELGELMAEARALDPAEQWRYSRNFKFRLRRWVGWNADHPQLRSCELHEACCREIVDQLALPPIDTEATS